MSKSSKKVKCNLCGSSSQEFLFKVKKFGKPFKVVKCSCGFIFVNPQPTMEFLESFYDKAYFSGEKSHKAPGQYDYEENRPLFLPKVRVCLKNLNKKGKKKGRRYLDVGCATGYFVRMFQEKGWKAQGIDISEFSTDYARNECGLDVMCGDICEADLKKGSYDLITMFNVIEHMPDPKAALVEMERILKKDGTIGISTPNAGYILAKMTKANWWGFNDEGHIHLFSLKTLEKMGEKAGLDMYIYIGSDYSYGNSFGEVWSNASGIKLKLIRTIEFTLITKITPGLFKISRPLADLLTPGTICFFKKKLADI